MGLKGYRRLNSESVMYIDPPPHTHTHFTYQMMNAQDLR